MRYLFTLDRISIKLYHIEVDPDYLKEGDAILGTHVAKAWLQSQGEDAAQEPAEGPAPATGQPGNAADDALFDFAADDDAEAVNEERPAGGKRELETGQETPAPKRKRGRPAGEKKSKT